MFSLRSQLHGLLVEEDGNVVPFVGQGQVLGEKLPHSIVQLVEVEGELFVDGEPVTLLPEVVEHHLQSLFEVVLGRFWNAWKRVVI